MLLPFVLWLAISNIQRTTILLQHIGANQLVPRQTYDMAAAERANAYDPITGERSAHRLVES